MKVAFNVSTPYLKASNSKALGVESNPKKNAFNIPSTTFNKTYLQHYFNSQHNTYQLDTAMLNVEGR